MNGFWPPLWTAPGWPRGKPYASTDSFWVSILSMLDLRLRHGETSTVQRQVNCLVRQESDRLASGYP